MENNTLLEQFKDECEVIEFKYEYPGYVGYEQYGIITDLSESELTEKYKDLIKDYSPYMILDSNYKNARDEYRKNDKKHNWRASNTIDIYNYEDGEMELFHPELIGISTEDCVIDANEKAQLYVAIRALNEKQRSRIISYFFLGMTSYEIAEVENTTHQAVLYGLEGAIKKLKKILGKTLAK